MNAPLPRRYWVADTAAELSSAGSGSHVPLLVLGDDAQRMLAWATRAGLTDGRLVLAAELPREAPLPALVHALATLLDDAGIPRVDLYGEGHGAAVAHLFIRVHGSRVRRLVLYGFGLPLRKHRHREWRDVVHELDEHADAYDLTRKLARGGDVLLLQPAGANEFSAAERALLAASYPACFEESVAHDDARLALPAARDAAVLTFLARRDR